MEAALQEMQKLHAELGQKLDAHKASDPNDSLGIGLASSKMKGVGKCIEIMQRHMGAAYNAEPPTSRMEIR